MSALRLSVPGQPVRLIDQGPATGRVTHTRSGIRGSIGGALVTPAPPRKRSDGSDISPARRAQVAAAHARYEAKHK